jgi:hypothetical protein
MNSVDIYYVIDVYCIIGIKLSIIQYKSILCHIYLFFSQNEISIIPKNYNKNIKYLMNQLTYIILLV